MLVSIHNYTCNAAYRGAVRVFLVRFLFFPVFRSSGKAVEKSLSFCGVIVSHDVNASRNTAAHKRDEASAPPLLKRTTSAMSAVPSSHAHVQGGSVQHVDRKGFHQRRVYVSGCGWMYVDVLKTHGLFDCLLEHFAIITVRDCQYLDSAKIFLALDKNPYSLGLLPGATVVFHNAVVKVSQLMLASLVTVEICPCHCIPVPAYQYLHGRACCRVHKSCIP